MRSIAGVLALTFACGVSQPVRLLAKGSGGQSRGHSSGHSGARSSHGSGHGGSRATSRSGGSHAAGRRTSSGSREAVSGRSSGTSATLTAATGARPRDGRPIIGTAVPRPEIIPAVVPTPFLTAPVIVWPRYTPGFRFGSFGYYAGSPLDPYPVPGAYAADPFDGTGPTGKLRLQIEPRTADVFVDGFYAGSVDDFDGVFQRLTLAAGAHHILVNSLGYQPLEFDVRIEPHQTTTYRGGLQR